MEEEEEEEEEDRRCRRGEAEELVQQERDRSVKQNSLLSGCPQPPPYVDPGHAHEALCVARSWCGWACVRGASSRRGEGMQQMRGEGTQQWQHTQTQHRAPNHLYQTGKEKEKEE